MEGSMFKIGNRTSPPSLPQPGTNSSNTGSTPHAVPGQGIVRTPGTGADLATGIRSTGIAGTAVAGNIPGVPNPNALRAFIENGPGQVTSTALNKPLAKGLEGTNAANPVDFKKMGQEQQYDYLQKMTIQRAGGDKSAWKTGDREVNLIGVRSFNGTPQGQKVDQYDDMIYVARMVDGKKTVTGFPASVDAGIQKGGQGTPYRLEDGFYKDAFSRGNVSGGELGLRQVRALEVWTDANNDGMLQQSELDAGTRKIGADEQLQFHRGGMGAVGDASRGCQVIDPRCYDQFQQILREAPASQRDFSYNLTDCSTLPGIKADGSSQDTAADRAYYEKNRHFSLDGDGIGIIRTPDHGYYGLPFGFRW
jgi:hypothetical protein